MQSFILPKGLYAIFNYKGWGCDPSPFKFIFKKWLPSSDYKVDNSRPHFELLGKKFKYNSLNSEEDIYIPLKIR